MANEITVNASIKVLNGSLSFNSAPTSYRATQTTKKGPSPGSVTVTTSGVTVSLAALTTPGIAHFINLDATNYVRYGLYIASTFYPFGKLKPGESAVLRLSDDILTANTAAAVLRFVANTATCIVQVNVMDD